jgi:hypothetical protein
VVGWTCCHDGGDKKCIQNFDGVNGRWLLGRLRRRWDVNIGMDVRETGNETGRWM